MSIKIMSQIWEYPKVKGTNKLALLALADHANDNGYCFPAYDKLASKVGVGRRQVINIIEALAEQGDIWVIPEPGHRNRYVVVAGQERSEIVRRLIDCGSIETSQIESIADLILSRQRGETQFTGAENYTGEISSKRGETQFTGGVKPSSPKPSVNRKRESSKIPADPAAAQTALVLLPEQVPKKQPIKPTPPHQAIIDAYVTELGYTPPNMGKEARAAKWLTTNQYTPEQVAACYWHLKSDRYWSKQFVSLQKVAEQIAEFIRAPSPLASAVPDVVPISISAFRGRNDQH